MEHDEFSSLILGLLVFLFGLAAIKRKVHRLRKSPLGLESGPCDKDEPGEKVGQLTQIDRAMTEIISRPTQARVSLILVESKIDHD